MTKAFIDNCVIYLINNYDYYFYAEIAFLDTFARAPHNEDECFMMEIRNKSDYDYSPIRRIILGSEEINERNNVLKVTKARWV